MTILTKTSGVAVEYRINKKLMVVFPAVFLLAGVLAKCSQTQLFWCLVLGLLYAGAVRAKKFVIHNGVVSYHTMWDSLDLNVSRITGVRRKHNGHLEIFSGGSKPIIKTKTMFNFYSENGEDIQSAIKRLSEKNTEGV